MPMNKLIHKLTAPQLTILGFLSLIIIGTFLLKLPISSNETPLSLIDALFTSTSAICVTGLIVVDTSTQFSGFGQFVILLLIQIGGYGILTISSYILLLMRKKITMHLSEGMSGSFLQLQNFDLKTLLKTTLFLVFGSELVITIFLFSRLIFDFSFGKALWIAVFHSVSSFCNAGFSLFPDSIVRYADDPMINITLMISIIAGGLGFFVLIDLINFFRRSEKKIRRSLTFHSKIVLSVTSILVVGGAVLFFLIEYKHNLSNLNIFQSILRSFFQSVTTRTAGFNSMDFQHLSNASLFLLMMFMFIGGAPGSMAGGVKVTTFGILGIIVLSRLRGKSGPELFGRTISRENLEKAVSLILLSLGLIAFLTLILLLTELGGIGHTESRGMFLEILFEAFSAFGTVGLSTGITSQLSDAGRVIITMLMFIGRLGPLTLAFALDRKKTRSSIRLPEERIMIG